MQQEPGGTRLPGAGQSGCSVVITQNKGNALLLDYTVLGSLSTTV
jgi:hypothetical protein